MQLLWANLLASRCTKFTSHEDKFSTRVTSFSKALYTFGPLLKLVKLHNIILAQIMVHNINHTLETVAHIKQIHLNVSLSPLCFLREIYQMLCQVLTWITQLVWGHFYSNVLTLWPHQFTFFATLCPTLFIWLLAKLIEGYCYSVWQMITEYVMAEVTTHRVPTEHPSLSWQ